MLIPVILQQAVLNLSITTAVSLGLHGFFVNLSTKYVLEIRNTDYELSNTSGQGSRGSKNALSNVRGDPIHAGSHSGLEKDDKLKMYDSKSKINGFRPDLVDRYKAYVSHGREGDWEDRTSDGSQENIIRQTLTWEVSRDTPTSCHDADDLQSLSKSVPNSQKGKRLG